MATASPGSSAVPLTQRAYTVRLLPVHGEEGEPLQQALWQTHEAVNRGVSFFGNWFLTLRGGLGHELARTGRDDEAVRHVLLALSWLSVEDGAGAPAAFVVARGDQCDNPDDQDSRNRKVCAALSGILRERGLNYAAIRAWLDDCAPSLQVAIRPDAVWVNRSAAFTAARQEFKGLDSAYAAAAVFAVFKPEEQYFTLPRPDHRADADETGESFNKKAGQWLSTTLGEGEQNDTEAIVASLRILAGCDVRTLAGKPRRALTELFLRQLGASGGGDPDDSLRAAIGWKTGSPSKGRMALSRAADPLTAQALEVVQNKFREEIKDKESKLDASRRPVWGVALRQAAVGHARVPYKHVVYAVMADHAARRVGSLHSWVQRAEASRRNHAASAARLGQVPAEAQAWLDNYCLERTADSGAIEGFRIRPRAVAGWEQIIGRWRRLGSGDEDQRAQAARDLQSDWEEDKKFGDIRLFEDLAANSARCVWVRPSGKPDESILRDYVTATDARAMQGRLKVPAYRHPDPLAHPAFCDFGKSRWSIHFGAQDKEAAELRTLRLTVWDGSILQKKKLRWASRRLERDLAIGSTTGGGEEIVLATRFGRAQVSSGSVASVRAPFLQRDWNGRLQAPRAQLNRIAELQKEGKQDAATKLRKQIRWFLTVSPKLQPCGPFYEYAQAHEIAANWKGEFFPNSRINEGRGKKAKLALARLPGLRVLSVDLGHRVAAACAVWETLTSEDLASEMRHQTVVAGSQNNDALYLHAQRLVDGRPRRAIYRRIGPALLPDGTAHPAPWARLDRQFLIRLQGERRPARAATDQEHHLLAGIERALGRCRTAGEALPGRVDRLQAEAVRTARAALLRHGDRARIAFALTATYKPLPGGRQQSFLPGDAAHTETIVDALVAWFDLFSSYAWVDVQAEALWSEHIATLQGYRPPAAASGAPPREPVSRRRDNADRLRAAAQALAADARLRLQLHTAFSRRWQQDDADWRRHLRQLKDWFHPSARQALTEIRNVGGLSLSRLATLTEFRRKVQVGYFTRLHPGGEREVLGAGFGQRSLDALERLRQQRVKQLASRIVEAALGLGCEQHADACDRRRPRQRVYKPCHAVVIESLRHYRPDGLRTRRENRALMRWSSSRIQKCLAEGCRLYGLYLWEVPPNYTSRQSSRTAAPGIRCTQVSLDQFRTSRYWRNRLAAANARQAAGRASAEDIFFSDIETRIATQFPNPLAPRHVLVPHGGGELFLAAGTTTQSPLHADLNAAANIGLRALLDPDLPARWWYVPCTARDGRHLTDLEGAAPLDDLATPLLSPSPGARRDVVNAWREPSCLRLSSGSWAVTTGYWANVQNRALLILRTRNGLD